MGMSGIAQELGKGVLEALIKMGWNAVKEPFKQGLDVREYWALNVNGRNVPCTAILNEERQTRRALIRIHGWEITLDYYRPFQNKVLSEYESPVIYTRIRAPFVNTSDFRFAVFHRNLASDVGTLPAGAVLVNVASSYPEFDRDFAVLANDEDLARELFSSRRIRSLIRSQDALSLQVKDDEGLFGVQFPEGVDELYFQVSDEILDGERLGSLIELFVAIRNRLYNIGAASRATAHLDYWGENQEPG